MAFPSIPGYHLECELGAGAQSTVYRARQLALDRTVAVKVIARDGAADRQVARFLREARLCAMLSHPHVVKLFDAGETSSWLYLVMELVEGRSLDRQIAYEGSLGPARLLLALEHLADALDLVHTQGIVHRDLKPANVMVTAAGEVKLADFGLARGAMCQVLTAARCVVGSPHYLAPETVVHRITTSQSDLYALGITLYEAATGTHPYRGLDPLDALRRIASEPLPPASRYQPGLPAAVDRLLASLLQKDAARRPPSARALLDEVRRLRASRAFLGTTWETSRVDLGRFGWFSRSGTAA